MRIPEGRLLCFTIGINVCMCDWTTYMLKRVHLDMIWQVGDHYMYVNSSENPSNEATTRCVVVWYGIGMIVKMKY